MPKYKFIVLTEPVEGRDAEFNDWYQNVHLGDVVAIEGFTAAQRFRFAKTLGGGEDEAFPYLAIYEIETDDIDEVLAELNRRRGTERMGISEALGPKVYAVVYEEFGSPVESQKPG